MTQERLELIERYLGRTDDGLIFVAWRNLQSALTSLWAGAILGHVDIEPRVERLKKALDQFKTVSADMTRDLGLEDETVEVIGLLATHPGANTVLDFNQDPEDAAEVDHLDQAYSELGGEG